IILNKKSVKWIVGTIVLGGLAFASYKIGAKTTIAADFNVFWQAGKNYGDGVSLYQQIGGACRYIYPPFAAMLFRFFALFSLQTAAAIYCFVNFIMWFGVFYYTRAILRLCNIPKRNITIGLWVGFILSFRYFLYHLNFIQMNELMLLMSLAGIKALFEKKNILAIGLLVVATFIKIIPVFILIWALSKSKFKNYIYAAGFALLCLGLPLVMRGIDTGVNDIKEYYETFLGPVSGGRVEVGVENQGLSSALYKVFTITPDGTKYNYFISELPVDTLKMISKIILLILFASYALLLGYAKFFRKTVSLLEISYIMLFTLLVSGIAWEYHFVSYGFVFTVLTAQYLNAPKNKRWPYYTLFFIALANDIIGSSTVGFAWYYKSCGYSFLTLMALFVAVFQYMCYFSREKNYPIMEAFGK